MKGQELLLAACVNDVAATAPNPLEDALYPLTLMRSSISSLMCHINDSDSFQREARAT